MITTLKPNEVFVFGSNAEGFHGAGAAGFACRGDARNNWRQDPWFLAAMKSPIGSRNRVGKWAVYEIARGYQEGREGKSYAVVTCQRPGARRSTTLKEILMQVRDLRDFAFDNPHLTFLLTPLGTGYSGYTAAEMWDQVWVPADVVGQPNIDTRYIQLERAKNDIS